MSSIGARPESGRFRWADRGREPRPPYGVGIIIALLASVPLWWLILRAIF